MTRKYCGEPASATVYGLMGLVKRRSAPSVGEEKVA